MHISDFDFELPPDRIASEPAAPRDAARLMVLDARRERIVDANFSALADFLDPTDVLVLNDSRVIRARTGARLERRGGTGRSIEVFFAEPVRGNLWQVLCRPGRRIRPGDRAIFAGGEIAGTFREDLGGGLHLLEVESPEPVERMLEKHGRMPLPPYIERAETEADARNYQTVFARRPGAVAAPTAGLHFTEAAIARVEARGVEVARLTLHVGIGTFLPVRTERPEDHVLRPERYEIDEEMARRLNGALAAGRRIVAVGTTTTRTLEFLMRRYGEIRAGAGVTDLYILPGFEFRAVGALLTNFHLPRSTLLMLVCAFAGREAALAAYGKAVDGGYRFYSYGDCMLIVR